MTCTVVTRRKQPYDHSSPAYYSIPSATRLCTAAQPTETDEVGTVQQARTGVFVSMSSPAFCNKTASALAVALFAIVMS